MIADPHPVESERLRALSSYNIIDTPDEAAFDDITRIAAYICQTPVALVSLVESGRQWFKSKVGVEISETSRDVSFCAHAILQSDLLLVPDALEDLRFKENALVTGDPRIRFYAGAVIQTSEGLPLGTVCVIDTKPRTLTMEQQEILSSLARQAMALLELRRTLSMAERANQYRSRLMAVAGHDLKQPLQVAIMFGDRIARSLTAEKDLQAAGHVRQALLQLGDDMDALAAASRLGDDNGIPRAIDIPVQPILSKIADTWRHHADRKGLKLTVAPSSAIVHTDSGMLISIIGNLVGNAIKYTESGRVLIGCRVHGGRLSVMVLDSGIGIPEDKFQDIFRSFQQLDTKRDGLGLGLSIVRRTAELLGYQLKVSSVPGKGSCFSVDVPLGIDISRSYSGNLSQLVSAG